MSTDIFSPLPTATYYYNQSLLTTATPAVTMFNRLSTFEEFFNERPKYTPIVGKHTINTLKYEIKRLQKELQASPRRTDLKLRIMELQKELNLMKKGK